MSCGRFSDRVWSLAGIGFSLAGAAALTRLVSSLLADVSATNPIT